jgi:ferric-dicitrate binding protein FerR (iron transport regulator)
MRYLLLLVPAALLAGPARYARVGIVEGPVEVQVATADPWIAAEHNAPLPESARVRTGAASRAEIELDEGSALRLGPNSEAELSDYARLSTGQRVTLVSIARGLAYVTGAPEGRDALTLALPGAQLTFTRSARVRVEVEEQWSAIAVLKGAARFSSPAADLELREGQTTRVEPANPARFFFYKEVLPSEFDLWSQDRDDALVSPSAAHTIQRYGLADLDGTGEWILTPDLGAVWRPKVAEDWRPYRDGRWRWYDGLGYTWVSAEPWGWLPYHYGRWTRLEKLGWVWAPSKNGVFKPGDVYWLRGAEYAGWGPLAPGEQWDPADETNKIPAEFLKANTTYAAFRPNANIIDPSGFDAIPEDPLKDVDFLTALPSPPFAAGRLDAVRPLVNAATLRVKPIVEGVAVEPPLSPRPERRPPTVAGPAPAPLVLVTQAPAPPPETEVVEVPVPVPAGVVFVAAPSRETRHAAASPVPSSRPAPPPPNTRREKRARNAAESAIADRVVRLLESREFPKALADLEQWTSVHPHSDLADERAYYYMLAFHGLNQPAKVVERGGTIVTRHVRDLFDDPMQALSVVYLTATDFQRVSRPTREQSAAARYAARELLAILPVCFTPERRPDVLTPADWAKSRNDLEKLARETLSRSER